MIQMMMTQMRLTSLMIQMMMTQMTEQRYVQKLPVGCHRLRLN
jgi:hypothetical protein